MGWLSVRGDGVHLLEIPDKHVAWFQRYGWRTSTPPAEAVKRRLARPAPAPAPAPATPTPVPAPAPNAPVGFWAMTDAELVAELRTRKVRGRSKLKGRAAMIEALEGLDG